MEKKVQLTPTSFFSGASHKYWRTWLSCWDPDSMHTSYPHLESLSWVLSGYKTYSSALLLNCLISVRVDSLYRKTKKWKLAFKSQFWSFLSYHHRHRNWVALLWDFPCLLLAWLSLLILISFHFIQWIKSSFVYETVLTELIMLEKEWWKLFWLITFCLVRIIKHLARKNKSTVGGINEHEKDLPKISSK